MLFRETPLKGAFVVETQPHVDARGQFARVWCREAFARQGIEIDMVQGNASMNPARGTLRGLHYQLAPHGEAKLVRCVRGAIYDVIVDIDPASPSHRRWFGIKLTPASRTMLYVPTTCAHGFQTLADDTEVHYLVSAPYAPAAARGLRHDDPALAIAWPLPVGPISEADRKWPLLEQLSAVA